MSACAPFNIPFTGSANDLLEKAKSKLAQMNGTITGSETAGSFAVSSPIGAVTGTYTISGQTFTVTVTEKPMMLGCGMLEGLLKGALG
jgi:hypothetical protein